jgi:hypothetical protein
MRINSGGKHAAFVSIGVLASAIVGLYITPPVYPWMVVTLWVAIVVLLLYATGRFTAFSRQYHLRTRKGFLVKRPQIGILNNMGWDDQKREISTFTNVKPGDWKREIKKQANQKNLKVKVGMIKKNFHRYSVIVNPYGGVYPETDLVRLETLDRIFTYVAEGGLFVSVADIPGFWAYSENLKRKRHATSPVWYRTEERGLVGEITFMLTPFMVKLGLEVYNTRPITIVNNKRTVSHLLDTEGAPLVEWNTECVGDYSFLREGSQKMMIHRVAKIESNTSPVFRTRSIGTIEVTPFFIESLRVSFPAACGVR